MSSCQRHSLQVVALYCDTDCHGDICWLTMRQRKHGRQFYQQETRGVRDRVSEVITVMYSIVRGWCTERFWRPGWNPELLTKVTCLFHINTVSYSHMLELSSTEMFSSAGFILCCCSSIGCETGGRAFPRYVQKDLRLFVYCLGALTHPGDISYTWTDCWVVFRWLMCEANTSGHIVQSLFLDHGHTSDKTKSRNRV